MYCLSCGKAIPDESIFCSFCGTSQKKVETDSKETPKFRETTPVAIDNVYIWCAGQTETKKGIFDSWVNVDLFGRGFKCSFSLVDDSDKWTTADGQGIISLAWSYTGEAKPWGTNPNVLQQIKRNSPKSFFYEEFTVKKSDFSMVGMESDTKKWDELMHLHTHLTPLTFCRNDGVVNLHIWFRTNENKLLYKISPPIKWK